MIFLEFTAHSTNTTKTGLMQTPPTFVSVSSFNAELKSVRDRPSISRVELTSKPGASAGAVS